MAGNRRLFQMPNIIILFTIGLVGQIIATPVNIPLSSVSDLIIQSALNSFNEQSPTKHTYKGGSLISAQKLSSPPYTTYHLTLNLEADCQSENACPPEACSIDIKQHEQGVIEVVQESKQCTYLYPQSNSQLREASDEQVIRRLEKLLNDTAELRREVQDVSDDNDRPFVAVRPSHYCPGCPYELNPTLPGLAAFGELAASSMDNSEGSDFKHRIVSFVRVFRAVPPGSTVVRYEFLVEVGETNCLRTTPIERSECPLQTNIPIRLCLIRVDEKPWIHNSRELTYNNCTDSDKINELNGKIETTLTSESSIKETAQEPSESADNYDQIALEGQISTFQSPYESPLPSQNTEDCLSQSAVSEVPFTKSVIETEDAQSETPKFTDKFKEFDEFLKDFDIPLKPTTEKLPQFHGPEVVEETIQPDRGELKEISEEQPSVEVTRKRRAVDNRKNYEKSFILKLAQKAMSRLDDMDNDDSKRVIADILDYKRIDDEGFLYQINVLAALTSNCKESHKNIKDCTHNPESQQMSICKLQIQTDEKSTIETSKIVVSQCYPIEDDRMRRKRSPPLAGSPNPVSVDDADVQDYVKKGLKKYSQGLQSANEPIIVEVVSATQQVVAGTIHRIKVKIGESNCPKGTVLPGNCLLLQSTPPKECEIKVWSKPWENFEEIDVTCDEKRKKRGVPGGVNEISVDHPDIQNYVQKGLKKYSTGLQSTNEPMVTKVLSATQQTVAGSLYKIKVQIGESNCPKGTVLPGDCLLLQSTPPKNCEISVWSKPWENFEQIDVTCDEKRKKRGLAGGVNEISVDHPDIQNYVQKGLKKYSAGLQSTNEPMVTKVLSATRQTVAGSLYKIKVQIGESSCPKGTVLPGNCLLLQSTPPKNCEISVWSKPWENFEKIDVTCDEKRKKRSLNRALRLKRGMLGAPQAISVDHVNVRNYVQKGLKKLSADVEGTNEPIPVEVLSATHQTVSGSLYKITVRVGDSNCPKGTTSMENCLLLKNSPIKECLITVWTKTWEKFEDIKVECEPSSRRKRSLRGANYSQKMLGLGRQLEDERKFSEFQQRFNKVYASEEERAARFRIFQENMKIAENLQQYDQGTAEYGATMFADLTPHEFRSKYLGYRQDLRRENEIPMAQAKIPDVELPAEFDWRHYNVVTEVKDQGQCGSCWAFSVTGNIEGQYAIKHNKLISLSEQELVDCDKLDEGCNGGLQENAYRAMEQLGGLELENDYPYDAEDEKCHFKKNKAVVQVVSAVNITHNETQMAQWLVKNGPMAIAINANAMQFYMGGISHPFKFLCSSDSLDHGVLIVGYGVHTYPLFNKTIPYWIVKNSWGKRWGEQGYYRVYRGDGTCGVNADVSSAIIA